MTVDKDLLIQDLARMCGHMAHTLTAIYSWWDAGENVLDVNREWAESALERRELLKPFVPSDT